MDNPTISQVLQSLIADQGLKATTLAKYTGIPQPTLHRIIAGKTINPHQDTLLPLADYFGISIKQLLGSEPLSSTVAPPKWHQIPILNWQQAAHRNAQETIENHTYTNTNVSANAYALIVKDASMAPDFPINTTLIIDPDVRPKDRSFIVASLNNNEAIFRQILIDGTKKYLKVLSPDFQDRHLMPMGIVDRCCGVLIQSQQDYQ